MDLKNFDKSKAVRITLICLGVAVVLFGTFGLGITVGYHWAGFSGHFGEAYERNFIDSRHGFFRDAFSGDNLPPSGHGAAGQIVSVALPLVVVASPDKLEKTILMQPDTLVRKFRDEATSTDLKTGDYVVVLGNPNDKGQIEARFVRIVPPPNMMMGSSTSAHL